MCPSLVFIKNLPSLAGNVLALFPGPLEFD